jgi:anti-sigma-K factor RskA
MRTDNCREWRESLGAYALGHLPAEERAALEAHLEGCPGCRAEAESLAGVARLMAHADPQRIAEPAPRPSPELGKRIAATIGAERAEQDRRQARGRRRRLGLRLGLALSGAAAAAAVVLALVILPGGEGGPPEQHVTFAALPSGVHIYATLEPHSYGTEIRMYVSGMRSGTLCRVYLRSRDGQRMTAGTFRYRWGNDSEAVLSSALDLSRTAAIGVNAGGRTFVAPVDRAAALTNHSKEDPI